MNQGRTNEETKVEERTPRWAVGDSVWYDSGTVGLLFRAVVKTEPYKLAGETWVVGIGHLPPEYNAYSGKAAPPIVVAFVDTPCNVYPRHRDDDRSYIHWDQYRFDQLPESSKIGHVAETIEEDTRSR